MVESPAEEIEHVYWIGQLENLVNYSKELETV